MTPLASIQITSFFAVALFVVGFFGLAILLFAAVFRGIAALFRCVFGAAARVDSSAPFELSEHCPHDRCGHLNPPQARFCARCGRALRRAFQDFAA